MPPLSGVSMSPRAWTMMESHDLPQHAPERVKPRRTRDHNPPQPPQRRPQQMQMPPPQMPPPQQQQMQQQHMQQQQMQQQQQHYYQQQMQQQQYAEAAAMMAYSESNNNNPNRIPTPQPSRMTAQHPMYGGGVPAEASRQQYRSRATPRAQVLVADQHLIELEAAAPPLLRQYKKMMGKQQQQSPRAAPSEAEIALTLGELSGARACQALLRGEIAPIEVSRSICHMPPELMPEFLEDFAMCIHLVGSMLPPRAMRALAPAPWAPAAQ